MALAELVSVKAKIALPFLMASFLAASVEREEAISSKAPEEGKESRGGRVSRVEKERRGNVPDLRDIMKIGGNGL